MGEQLRMETVRIIKLKDMVNCNINQVVLLITWEVFKHNKTLKIAIDKLMCIVNNNSATTTTTTTTTTISEIMQEVHHKWNLNKIMQLDNHNNNKIMPLAVIIWVETHKLNGISSNWKI